MTRRSGSRRWTGASATRAVVAGVLAAAALGLSAPGAAAQEDEALQPAPSLAEAEVDYAYGLAAYRDGDLDEAGRLLRRAVAYGPEHGGAWYALGLVHLARGETEEARRHPGAVAGAPRPARGAARGAARGGGSRGGEVAATCEETRVI